MHMRVVVQPARVGVQHCHRASAALELPVVVAESVKRLPGAFQQQAMQRALVVPDQVPELLGQGEDDEEIRPRNLALQLAL